MARLERACGDGRDPPAKLGKGAPLTAAADWHGRWLQVRTFTTAEREKEFVLEEAIVADFGLVRAWKGDRHGNPVFRASAQNFNPLAAMCGPVTIAEVENLVEPGEIDPAEVHTPGVFVQRVVPLTPEQASDKKIEKRTVRPRTEGGQ